MALRRSYVNQFMRRPRMTGGVPAAALGYIFGPAGIGAQLTFLSLNIYWAMVPVAMGVIGWVIVRWLYKTDPCVFGIYSKYAEMADEYHPDTASTLPPQLSRPFGAGRGLRI